MANQSARRVTEWGHWGLTFSWSDGGYAPVKIEGQLFFPVGNCGPCDGFLGSPERARYAEIVKAWNERGELPEGLHRYKELTPDQRDGGARFEARQNAGLDY